MPEAPGKRRLHHPLFQQLTPTKWSATFGQERIRHPETPAHLPPTHVASPSQPVRSQGFAAICFPSREAREAGRDSSAMAGVIRRRWWCHHHHHHHHCKSQPDVGMESRRQPGPIHPPCKFAPRHWVRCLRGSWDGTRMVASWQYRFVACCWK